MSLMATGHVLGRTLGYVGLLGANPVAHRGNRNSSYYSGGTRKTLGDIVCVLGSNSGLIGERAMI